MPVSRAPGVRLLVHALWQLAPGSPQLTPETRARLAPYTTRYAETMNTGILAVGGWDDHLHVFLDLPPDVPAEKIVRELQATTARFLSDALGVPGFAWDKTALAAKLEGVSARDADELAEYIRQNPARHRDGETLPEWECGDTAGNDAGNGEEELPGWLRDVLPGNTASAS